MSGDREDIRSYRDLIAWRKAMELAVSVYRLTDSFPKSELYGLTGQTRRAVVSVPANIAEGHARRRSKEFLHHLDIAYGSLAELETHIDLAERLGYVDPKVTAPIIAQASEVGRILNGLMKSQSAFVKTQDSSWRVAEEPVDYLSDPDT